MDRQQINDMDVDNVDMGRQIYHRYGKVDISQIGRQTQMCRQMTGRQIDIDKGRGQIGRQTLYVYRWIDRQIIDRYTDAKGNSCIQIY